MNNIFDLSELTDTQETAQDAEAIKNEELERASLFGLNENEIDSSKYTKSNTSVEQNKSKLQDADKTSIQGLDPTTEVDPTKLFFPDEKKDEDEESDKEKTVENTETKETKPAEKPKEGNATIKALAEALITNGVLTAEEKELNELKDYSDLENLVKASIKNSEYSDLNDSQKEYLDALRAGIPEEYIAKHQNITSQLNSIEEEDITEDENLAINLYSALLKNKGFSDDKIARYVNSAKTNETLVTEAKESLDELKEIQKNTFATEQKKLEDANKAKQEKIKTEHEEIKNFLTSGNSEVIKGNKIDSKTGSEILKSMTTAVDTIDGHSVNALQKFAHNNPVKYKAVLNYLFHQGFFTNDVKADKLKTAGKNEAIKKLEGLLNKETVLSGGNSVEVNDTDDMQDLISAASRL